MLKYVQSELQNVKYYLGKPHRKCCRRHLGIALLAIAPPPPHSNGHSGALHLGKSAPNHPGKGPDPPKIKQILPKKVAPNHPGKGLDPPPNGQCPNAWGDFFGGASLSSSAKKLKQKSDLMYVVHVSNVRYGTVCGVAVELEY